MIEQVTLDLLQVAMDMKLTEHKAASANIAGVNVPGTQRITVDFSALVTSLSQADEQGRMALINDIRQNWTAEKAASTHLSNDQEIKLDEETAELLLASGKYKLLAEGLNRKLGLMQVAVNGGKR